MSFPSRPITVLLTPLIPAAAINGPAPELVVLDRLLRQMDPGARAVAARVGYLAVQVSKHEAENMMSLENMAIGRSTTPALFCLTILNSF